MHEDFAGVPLCADCRERVTAVRAYQAEFARVEALEKAFDEKIAQMKPAILQLVDLIRKL